MTRDDRSRLWENRIDCSVVNGFQSKDVTKMQIGVVADAARVHQCSSLDIGVIHLDVRVDTRGHNRRIHVKCPLKVRKGKE